MGCSGPYPGPMGACSGYILKAGGKTLLLDCGSGILPRLQEKGLTGALDAMILTHLHSDHMSDALTLRYARQFQAGGKLRVLLPDEPAAESFLLFQSDIYACEAIEQGKKYTVGNASISFMKTMHPVKCFAVRIECEGKTLVYTGDTAYLPGMGQFAGGADLFVCDSAFSEAQRRPDSPHATAIEAARMASEARARRLMLTHYAPGADIQTLLAEAKSVFANTVAACENMMIQV